MHPASACSSLVTRPGHDYTRCTLDQWIQKCDNETPSKSSDYTACKFANSDSEFLSFTCLAIFCSNQQNPLCALCRIPQLQKPCRSRSWWPDHEQGSWQAHPADKQISSLNINLISSCAARALSTFYVHFWGCCNGISISLLTCLPLEKARRMARDSWCKKLESGRDEVNHCQIKWGKTVAI